MSIAYPISAIGRLTRDDIGPLAHSLVLVSRGFALLPGICLTTDAYRRHVRRAKVREHFPRTSVATMADADRLAARMVRTMLQCPVEPAVAEALEASRGGTWLVRASVDDVEPFTHVVPVRDLVHAVRAAWASPWAASRVQARLRAGQALGPEPVAVLLQVLPREARATGTIRRGQSGEGWEIAVGRGLHLGFESLDSRFLLTEQGSMVHELVDPNPPMSSLELTRLVAGARRVAGSGINEVHWLLADRGIYAIETRQASTVELKGIAASPGIAAGTARLVRTARDARDLRKGDIVVSTYLIPALTVCIPRVSGLVVESGGSTSHLAIVARQFGVPAVLGARGATELIRAGQPLLVDGNLGVVRLLPAA